MNETGLQAITGRLFDGETLMSRATVLWQEGKVLDVTTTDAPSTAQQHVLAPDEMLLPGLVDLHVHARPHYARWFLEAGVTTVRDAGNSLSGLHEQKTWAARRTGPRVFGAGTILDGENSVFKHFGEGALGEIGATEAGAWVLRTPQDAQDAVGRLAAAGADTVKLYEQLPPDVYAAAVAQARAHGLPVMTDLGMRSTRALSGAQVDAVQALALGVQTIEHGTGFALAFRRSGSDPTTDFPTDAVLDDFARQLMDAGTVLVPTLSVSQGLRLDQRQDVSHLPAGQHTGEGMTGLRGQWDRIHGFSAGLREAADWDFRLAAELSRRVQALGGLVGAGTDTPAGVDNLPGGGLHAELELLVQHAGLTPLQALRAATGHAHHIVGRGAGRLRPGSPADLLVVRGDPTQDITATRQLRQVIFGGQPLK